jgi:hypothetical protein
MMRPWSGASSNKAILSATDPVEPVLALGQAEAPLDEPAGLCVELEAISYQLWSPAASYLL